MTVQTKSLLVRGAVFMVLAGVGFALTFDSMFVRRTRMGWSVAFADVGVSLTYSPDGTATVRIDDLQQTLPEDQLKDSALYHEALQRVSTETRRHLGEQYWAFSWWRFARFWFAPAIAAYVMLFHVWPRARPSVEGPNG